MQLYSTKQIEQQRDLTERWIHQIMQPRHNVDGVKLCWPARLNRAQAKVAAMGERGDKAMAALMAHWEEQVQRANDAHTKYLQMCDATGQQPPEMLAPTCSCPGCVDTWDVRYA